MSFWSYRIVRYRNGSGYGLHEVYFDDDGQPWAMTNEPVGFSCDRAEGAKGIRESLLLARVSIKKHPVLDEPKKWPGKRP